MSSPAVSPPLAASPFIDAAAVEAWDAWFRWRCRGELRDVTVEASWDRVAGALAAAEPDDAERWQQRFREALANWKLLPDPELLRCAGTDACEWSATDLGAALNVAAFVRGAFTGWACFDHGAFRSCAELAVRMLDDAILLAGEHADAPAPRLRIGLIGVADALALLGIPYASAESQAQLREIAALLAEGTLAGSVRLARERGARLPFDAAREQQAVNRGTPAALVAEAVQFGLRHAALTAIDSQPRLALLANNVSDALDPLGAESDWLQIDAPGGGRRLRSYAFAHNLRRRHLLVHGTTAPPIDDFADCGIADQILLRAVIAPWIDAPIDCPFRVGDAPSPPLVAEWSALAASHSLPPPRWRSVASGAD